LEEEQPQYQDEEFISWMAEKTEIIGTYVNLSVNATVNQNLYLAKAYADQGYEYCLDAIDEISTFVLSPDMKEFYKYSHSFFVNTKWFFLYISLYSDSQDLNDLERATEYLEKANHDLENMSAWLKFWR